MPIGPKPARRARRYELAAGRGPPRPVAGLLPTPALSFDRFAAELLVLLCDVEDLVVAHALRLDLRAPPAAFNAPAPAIGLRCDLVSTLNVELVVNRHVPPLFLASYCSRLNT
jgi:hypothetical protein